jgi:hypothetical protein
MQDASDSARRRQAGSEVTLGPPRRGDGLCERAGRDRLVRVDLIELAVALRPLSRVGGYRGEAFAEEGGEPLHRARLLPS